MAIEIQSVALTGATGGLGGRQKVTPSPTLGDVAYGPPGYAKLAPKCVLGNGASNVPTADVHNLIGGQLRIMPLAAAISPLSDHVRHVVPLRTTEEVGGIATRGNVTAVTDDFGPVSVREKEHDTMRVSALCVNHHVSIPGSSFGPDPGPTGPPLTGVDTFPYSLQLAKGLLSHSATSFLGSGWLGAVRGGKPRSASPILPRGQRQGNR